MNSEYSQVSALESYEAALAFFRIGRFADAQKKVQEYRQFVDYTFFQSLDNRGGEPGHATVIIVTRDRVEDLRLCLDSLASQRDIPFETIVVDNGGNTSLKEYFPDEKILIIQCPVSFTPSEARNIGAFYARTDLFIFLDDDAVAADGFVRSAVQAFEKYPFLGIRGRILPKSANADQSLAGLYDLGDYPLPALLDVEGNMAVPRTRYLDVEGMNPLLFGSEGIEFTSRLLSENPKGEVYYWPQMVIRHDYASRDRLLSKRKRQALVNEYFRVMLPQVLRTKEKYGNLQKLYKRHNPDVSFKSLPKKIQNFGKDIGLILKSEKNLYGNEPSCPQNLLDLKSLFYPDNQSDVLSARIQGLEEELEATRNSITFRLGDLIRQSLSSPLKQGLLFPIRAIRLIKEYNNPTLTGAPLFSMKKVRNLRQYTNPGREEHLFSLFNDFTPYRKSRNSNIKIACILSPWLYFCLKFEAELIPLALDNWKEAMQTNQPDFLLVQPCIEASGTWRECFVTSDDFSSEFAKLMDYCRKNNIPSVLWDTEDHTLFTLFSKIAPLFDRIFTADCRNIEPYEKLTAKKTGFLGPAVQPVLHNPFKQVSTGDGAFPILFNGWGDILENPMAFHFLKPLLRDGLHIVESRYRILANKLDELPDFRENIMGCISYGQLLTLMRHYQVLIIPDKSLSSTMARSWQAIEAMACGCAVISNIREKMEIPDGLVIQTDGNHDLKEKTIELVKDETARLQRMHRIRRTLYSAHTYAHRIRSICESLGIRDDWEEFPTASVVLPTKRPEMIRSSIEKFNSQNYPSKEMIIVVNTDKIELNDVKEMADGYPNINVYQIHQEKNIGVCLNFGIANSKGKYWFKMDDDDYYGANYLTDMVMSAEAIDFDIMGKPRAFICFKDDGKIYLRKNAMALQLTVNNIGKSFFCGATLGGRREHSPNFSENHRACVDTLYVENGKDKGLVLLSSDIWNFIACRDGEKLNHTWRDKDKNIKSEADFFCNNLELNKVMI